MDATALRCPHCGGDLGPPQAGAYLCSHCGKRSLPPGTPVDHALRDRMVARAVAKEEHEREAMLVRERTAAADLVARDQVAAERRAATRDRNFNRVVLAASSLWMLGCFAGAACWALSGLLPDFVVQKLPLLGTDRADAGTRILLYLFLGVAMPPAFPLWSSLADFVADRRTSRSERQRRA